LSSGLGNANAAKRQKTVSSLTGSLFTTGGSLAIALQANRRSKSRTSFVRTSSIGTTTTDSRASLQTSSISFNHVVFRATENSQLSKSNFSNSAATGGSRRASLGSSMKKVSAPSAKENSTSASLWTKAVVAGFQKKK